MSRTTGGVVKFGRKESHHTRRTISLNFFEMAYIEKFSDDNYDIPLLKIMQILEDIGIEDASVADCVHVAYVFSPL